MIWNDDMNRGVPSSYSFTQSVAEFTPFSWTLSASTAIEEWSHGLVPKLLQCLIWKVAAICAEGDRYLIKLFCDIVLLDFLPRGINE